jgi:hypothetical protein
MQNSARNVTMVGQLHVGPVTILNGSYVCQSHQNIHLCIKLQHA